MLGRRDLTLGRRDIGMLEEPAVLALGSGV
jgi:hypothetical protein